MNRVIRIGTRKSQLAVAQAELVARAMKRAMPELAFELVKKQTTGDRILDRPLLEFGGKGVFVSELEQALLDGEIDFAVHSAKDLPTELADGLAIVGTPPREDARDVLITMAGREPGGEKEISVGTSSLRRRMQLERLRESVWPGLPVRYENLRGNVRTRLKRLEDGDCDAVILAAAGLKRLGLDRDDRYRLRYFDCQAFVPAGGQGILAVEGRIGDPVNEAAFRIRDVAAKTCLEVERRILKLLEAGCHEPVGVYSRLSGEELEVWGIAEREHVVREAHRAGPAGEAERIAGEMMRALTGRRG